MLKFFFYLLFIFDIITVLLFAQVKPASDASDFTSSNIPVIVINTDGKTINNAPKIIADMGIIDNGPDQRNYLTDEFNDYNGKIAVEIRGSSSRQFPKKSFAIETRDSLNNDLNVSLLGLPEDNDWVLYAPFTDKSFLRDILVYQLAREMGQYASRFRFCELLVYGNIENTYDTDPYKGVYILLEKIKRDKNRVNIKKLEPADTLSEDITGGYIIKIDKWDGDQNQGWQSEYYTSGPYKVTYQYHYPKPEDITVDQKKYIQNFIKAFENVMSGSQYNDPENGYPKYINVDSFVDNFILNEYSLNVDGYRLSSFFYKDNDSRDSKLYAGPVWDYNLAFGNADYHTGPRYDLWELEYQLSDRFYDTFYPPFWWRRLMRDKDFALKVKERWEYLRSHILDINKINSQIDSLANLLTEAQLRNYTKWNILNDYVWPNPPEVVKANTFEKQISYVKNWILNRTNWLDIALFGHVLDVNNEEVVDDYKLKQNYPNPFNPSTTIKFYIPEQQIVRIRIYNSLGEEVEQLLNKELSEGWHSVNWMPRNVSSGVYFYRLNAGQFSSAMKMLFIQ